ncbi:hypothetical protein SGQ83_02390 [Flavobacterium sp. Fl-318]|uniref:Uncharacterized protein n=1 Tax=Flavobacterium cupriresistens TaxID=2893885 RepID=A0ABU4R6H7_9FLAO|nr:hypothetical protein [Flavobacterium sp. Fl-318]MDX6188182.1 hypothetical protein [Flavobacterium sp. Fl-318]
MALPTVNNQSGFELPLVSTNGTVGPSSEALAKILFFNFFAKA